MRLTTVLFLALLGSACSGGDSLELSAADKVNSGDVTSNTDRCGVITSAPSSGCTDTVDCEAGQVCCVIPRQGAGNACVALADCLGCDAVVACRPDEASCGSLQLGGCFADTTSVGDHCANY